MMNFDEFVKNVRDDVLRFIPNAEELSVSVSKVHKNNGLCLTGLTIKSTESNVAPTIYLENFYEEYCQEDDYEDILRGIAHTYDNHTKGVIPDFSLESLDDSTIFGELVRTEGNEYLLRDIPSVLVFDGRFSVIFRYAVDVSDVKGSVLITDSIAEIKGFTAQMLYEIALKNDSKQNTPVLQTLYECLGSIISMDLPEPDTNAKLYVLTNETKLFGAFSILAEKTRKLLMDTFSGDLIVIPSSIHELILIPKENTVMNFLDEINTMIQEVNRTQVAPDEILGDEYFILKRTAKGYEFMADNKEPSYPDVSSSLVPAYA